MAADANGNDLTKVTIPVTGFAAVQLDGEPAFIEAAEGKKTPLSLPENYVKIGLFTEDGGPTSEAETGDAVRFFQDGYQLSGTDELTIKIKAAEMNETVRRLIRGKKADANGMLVVENATPDMVFPLFVATQFKNGMQLRRNGMARVSAVAQDQETRGEVAAAEITFTWISHEKIGGKYREWLIDATAAASDE